MALRHGALKLDKSFGSPTCPWRISSADDLLLTQNKLRHKNNKNNFGNLLLYVTEPHGTKGAACALAQNYLPSPPCASIAASVGVPIGGRHGVMQSTWFTMLRCPILIMLNLQCQGLWAGKRTHGTIWRISHRLPPL